MSIEVACPNGHTLHVKDKYAGQTGLCPHCHVRVLVPTPVCLSEDDIASMIGPPMVEDEESIHGSSRTAKSESNSGMSLLGTSAIRRGIKRCPKCHKDVSSAYNLCPHCHTYFSDRTEISRRMAAPCPRCGVEIAPGVNWCAACGADLKLH